MRSSIPKIVCAALILLAGGEELFATDVGGLICTNTTWNLAGSPYVVAGSSSLVIGCNATLTIEPGVVVRFDACMAIVVGSNAFGKGTLVARGTAESPIIFTSNTDALPGEWSRIHFTDYAVDAVFDADGNYMSGCIMEHIVAKYGGCGNYGVIFAEKSSPYLNDCNVRDNSYYGIQVDGTSAPSIKITNCEVRDNSQCGIYISGGSYHKLLYNNIHDNGGGGIYCDGGNSTLTDNNVTRNTGTGIIAGGGYSTLTDNNVTQNTGNGISTGSGSILTGNNVAQNTGRGISSTGGGSILTENTVTENTGGGISFWWGGGNTLTENTITGNTSSDDASGGIGFWYSGTNTLTGNTVTGNTGGGIFFAWSGGNSLSGNVITDNTSSAYSGGIYFGSSGSNTLTENTITDNTSSSAGGGIYFGGSVSNTLTRNVIQSNISRNGFGAVWLDASGDTVFLQNTISDNYIETGDTGGIYVTGNSERVSLAGDPNAHTYNIIQDNDGYWVYNGNNFNADGRNDVNAVYVQWGTSDILLIMERIFDYFDDGSKAFVLFYPFVIPGDSDYDEDVDWLDLKTFVDNWLRDDCWIPDWCEGADLDVNTTVDFFDFARFAEHWLEGVSP